MMADHVVGHAYNGVNAWRLEIMLIILPVSSLSTSCDRMERVQTMTRGRSMPAAADTYSTHDVQAIPNPKK